MNPKGRIGEAVAKAREPYARKILELENEIRLLRALARALNASQEALDATRYTEEMEKTS